MGSPSGLQVTRLSEQDLREMRLAKNCRVPCGPSRGPPGPSRRPHEDPQRALEVIVSNSVRRGVNKCSLGPLLDLLLGAPLGPPGDPRGRLGGSKWAFEIAPNNISAKGSRYYIVAFLGTTRKPSSAFLSPLLGLARAALGAPKGPRKSDQQYHTTMFLA